MPQKVVVSLQARDNSFDKCYDFAGASSSESYLSNLSSAIKIAQLETNQKLTEIIGVKSSLPPKELENEISENGDSEVDVEPTSKRVKNNSK